MTDATDKKQFEKNPNEYIEKLLKNYVATSPGNRLETFNGELIWDEPLVGFASGDDPLFQEYKKLIGDFHLTPREILSLLLKERGLPDRRPEHVSVISFIMPAARTIRESQYAQTKLPSARWNNAREFGQKFLNETASYIASKLEEMGYIAVVPAVSSFVKEFPTPKGGAFNWSERHVAYVAGLGTFSLNDGFITPRGIAMRVGSVVTDATLLPSKRSYKDHTANCLFYHEGSCRACIDRCPVGAISEKGHDQRICREYMFKGLPAAFKALGEKGEKYLTRYGACGLCQTKVPCEAMIPPKAR